MSKKLSKVQKARAAALEAALIASARAGEVTNADSVQVEPEEVLTYAKFILGKRPAKRKDATGHLNMKDGRAYWAPAGEPLPNPYEPWKPLGLLTEDGLKEDPSFSVADLFRRPPAATVPGPPAVAGATLEKFAEKIRDGDLAADPVPVTLENGIDLREVRTRLDSTEADEQFPPASPVGEDPGDRGILTQWAEAVRQQDAAREAAREARDLEVQFEDGKDPEVVKLTPAPTPKEKRKAEERLGLVAGALDEDLTFSSVGGFRFPNGEPAEKARAEAKEPEEEQFATSRAVTWAPQRHGPETSEKAPDHVVTQGASLGCPECSAEAERREKRDEALEEGRRKLAERLDATTGRSGPLDEDELLAVAGSEVYPPNDQEPSRELKIRNRKGEVWTFQEEYGGAGWTSTPGNPWSLQLPWTSPEMVRRGPWHVV